MFVVSTTTALLGDSFGTNLALEKLWECTKAHIVCPVEQLMDVVSSKLKGRFQLECTYTVVNR